ncbi:MFS transporter [Actinokineospora sp.]|uniref:MFS transporter n=1 Tax=Actinokineospora sp. TaxID=1872133 RepID=UPI004037863D
MTQVIQARHTAPRDRSRRGALFGLWAAAAVSGAGRTVSVVAIPWAVLATTGSTSQTGFAVVSAGLGMAFFGFLAGPLIDRIGAKRAAVGLLVVAGAVISLVPTLYTVGLLEYWAVLVIVLVASSADAVAMVAVRALVPETAERAGASLESANSMLSAIDRLSLLLTPVVTGAAIALTSVQTVLWIDTAACVLAALILAGTALAPTRVEPRESRSYLGELVDGVRTIWRDPVLRATGATAVLANALAGSLYSVVLIAYASEVFHSATAFAAMVGALGAGAVVGAVGFGVIGHKLPRRPSYLTGFAGAGLTTMLLALQPSLPVTLAVLALSGLFLAPIGPLMATVYQERTAAGERGRVFSAQQAVGVAALPAGVLVATAAMGSIGLSVTFLVIGGLNVLIAVVAATRPAIRLLDGGGSR